MNGFEDIAWLPLCAGLTALGLLATWFVGRKRGAASVMRGVAWSLIPVAAYLTGLLELAWRVVGATAQWATRLIFSPIVWIGVVVAGLSVVLFLASGVLRRRGLPEGGQAGEARRDASKELKTKRSGTTAASDDFSDVEEILRRRGIS